MKFFLIILASNHCINCGPRTEELTRLEMPSVESCLAIREMNRGLVKCISIAKSDGDVITREYK